ncbi:MAG TPA: 4Fe-4S dicluster domain-containing protein, partial [Candidatus Aminicenantes bacterium]|nr:4Fe-4S dicluster domain-containing protein [Candidatus Aminicenantes bacterium]
RRLARTTVVTITCTHADEYCFCTSVGGGPGNSTGSDLLLTPLEGGTYLAEVLTARGQALLALVPESSTPANAVDKESRLACVPSRFTAETVTAKMAVAFDREGLWREQSLRCLGCGACAFVCPTCACFDISDESNGIQGKRLRTWDSCGFSLFTKHTSGHNPREVQSQRWRQRLMHKFVYMPDRLKVLGCVGCGRCSRSCPVDMNILEHVTKVAEVK